MPCGVNHAAWGMKIVIRWFFKQAMERMGQYHEQTEFCHCGMRGVLGTSLNKKITPYVSIE
jgi:hypothetical protein